MTNGYLTRKIVRPLLELLRQGVTPEKLSMSIALGAVLGMLPAIQMVNYFLYPLQIALLLPFFRLGEKLFGAPHLPISVPQIYGMVRTNLWGAVELLWTTTWHALVVWALLAPFVAALIYFPLLPAFRRVLKKTHVHLQAEEVAGTRGNSAAA